MQAIIDLCISCVLTTFNEDDDDDDEVNQPLKISYRSHVVWYDIMWSPLSHPN